MKTHLQTLGVALGYTTLALIWIPGPLDRDAHYWMGRPIALFLPSLLDFVLAWFAIAILLHCVRRPGRVRNFVWSTLLAFAPILAIEAYALLEGTYVSPRLRLVLGLFCILLWLLLQTALTHRFARHAEVIIHAASVVLLFIAINGVYVLSHGVWLGWQARHLNTVPAKNAVLQPPPSGRPRIIWIVMDELSYQQVYGHRFAGLSLPAFDALAAESSVFTNITPASNMTEFSLPDYMTGIPGDHDDYLSDGRLAFRRHDNGQRVVFDQQNTIFQDAHHDGYNTGISGWFIPYCRLLSDVTDRCTWSYSNAKRNGMLPNASVGSNILAPFRRLASYVVPARFKTSWLTLESNAIIERREHIADYHRLVSAADQLLLDRNVDFVLLHIPVPHMPGIYDRKIGALDAEHQHGYIDNLALANECLAHLRSTLVSSGQWDTSTVLVMGDHGWRLEMGSSDDAIAGAGGFDPRPAYIIKLAGQHQPATIAASYDALRTRSLLQALQQQTIHTPEDLAAWVRHTP